MMHELCSAWVGEEMETGNGTIAAVQSLAIWHISFALSDFFKSCDKTVIHLSKDETDTFPMPVPTLRKQELSDAARWSDAVQGHYQNC